MAMFADYDAFKKNSAENELNDVWHYRLKQDTVVRIHNNDCYFFNRHIGDDVYFGASYVSLLSHTARSLEEICAEAIKTSSEKRPERIREYAIKLFARLEIRGFIVSGKTEAEMDKKETPESYQKFTPEYLKHARDPAGLMDDFPEEKEKESPILIGYRELFIQEKTENRNLFEKLPGSEFNE
jgi:hypothetical protein